MSELIEVQDNVRLENKHVQQLIAAIKGWAEFGVQFNLTNYADAAKYALDLKNGIAPGLHFRVTHSSGSPVLFQVTDSGVLVSPDGVIPATNPYVYKGMVVGWDSALTIPTGWAICDGTGGTPDLRDRFIVGSGLTYALAATGGSAAVNLQHLHAMAHTHGMSHTHNHHHSMNHKHVHDHDHDLQDHRHLNTHTHKYDIDHNHVFESTNTQHEADASFERQAASGSDFYLSHRDHYHEVDLANHDVADRDTEDAQNQFSVSPNNSLDGYTSPAVKGYGGTPNDSKNSTGNTDTGSTTAEAWTLTNLTSGSGNNTDDDASSSSSSNTGSESNANTSNALSTTQSILPPYYAMIWIKRTV